MIQPLRTAHRRIFVVLAAVLPMIIATGLGARRVRVANQRMPIAASTPDSPHSTSIRWKNATIAARVYVSSVNPDSVTLLFHPSHELSDPDLLLYWAEQDVSTPADLSHARLLGSFTAGKSFSLPREPQAGFLILYSLAHRVVVDTAKVERLP